MQNRSNLYGFTIVELSISLVIIALLVGAVMSAQNVKRAVELKQTISEFTTYNQALSTFRGGPPSGYSAMPGDYSLAETAFGEESVGNKTADGNGDGNGDGDLLIETNLTSPTRNEALLLWQHLAAASLINGSYDGTTNGPGGRPEGTIRNSIYGASTSQIGAAGGFPNALHLYISKNQGSTPGYGILTTKEAYDIDVKNDDGDPETGSIRGEDGTGETAGDCVSGTSPNQDYNLSNSNEKPCKLHFYEREYD